MATDVEDILAAARSLPRAQQLEVLRRLAESLSGTDDALEAAALGFWAFRSLDELAEGQPIAVGADVRTLAMADWPDEESTDDFIAFVHDQRHADRET
jgi:broad specificity phosphatase PhoE